MEGVATLKVKRNIIFLVKPYLSVSEIESSEQMHPNPGETAGITLNEHGLASVNKKIKI